MSIKITITEKEIADNPNNFELGQLVRTKYFELIKELENLTRKDEN